MGRPDSFDRAVTAAAVAAHLCGEISDALVRKGRTPPADLLAILRSTLGLEPDRDRARDHSQLADLVNSLDGPTPAPATAVPEPPRQVLTS
jgi:hypothetical protein